MKWLFFCVLAVLMVASAYAATITGTVYDLSLEPVSNAVIEIDTKPTQRMVSRNGMYRFDVPPGEYELIATVKEDGIVAMGTQEDVTVEGGGDYTFDLFLYEDFSEEDDLLDMETLDVDEELFETSAPRYVIFIVAFGVALTAGAVFYLFLRSKKGQIEDKGGEDKTAGAHHHAHQQIKQEDAAANAKEEIIAILKAHDGRMTQKELRRKLAHSEAKVSIVLAELEEEGRIKKIKKGRGNILILK